MKEKIKKILKRRNIIDIIILIVITLIISIPLLNNKLDVYFDDGIQHISRAYGTAKSMQEGNYNIITDFANDFGYSWNLFYGPLTTYGIIIFELIFKNFIMAYKVLLYCLLLLSGIFMYKLVFKMFNNRNVALLSGVIYILAPYHLTDIYIRNALGEFASFVFIPLVFLGLYNLFNTTENNYYLAIGAIGLILTHNLSTIITSIFALIYVFVNIKELKNYKIIKGLLINIIFIILITSFFWIPLLETRFSADYCVYEDGFMATPESTAARGLNVSNLFITYTNDIFVFEVGPCLILLAFSIITLRNLQSNRKEYILFLIFSILSLFMATKYFPWKYLPKCFAMIQFPWRMLEFSSFFLSIVCSINAYIVIKNFNLKDTSVLILILLIYTLALNPYIPYSNEKLVNIENFEQGIVTGKESEIVIGIAKGEYLTTKANNNKFYVATRENKVYVLNGKAIIENENKTNKNLTFKVKNLEETEYEAPYIYYPGYEVTVDGIRIEEFETENGFLGFKIGEQTEATVEISYRGTKLMNISKFISIVSFLGFCIYIWKKY